MATFGGSRSQNKENMLVIDNSGKGLKKLDKTEVNESTVQCTTLILDKNGLSRVDHLEVYPHLQQLSIANNRLIRINGVSKLRTLKVLNIPNNSIQSIEGLRELLELEWLNLSGNSLKSVEHLSSNVNLRYLDLSDNSISIISDVSMLKQLKTLLLHGNILTTLRSFPAYIPTSLEILSLAENEISDLAEVSYLSCLSQLKQLAVMNNPCVMFNASSSSSSHGGFDYRPFVVNWCLTLELLDGNTITQKESLRAEWLYSQGKGRKFYPGQHFQLAEYLSQTCPLTTASELQSKEDERLCKVLKQQEKHMHDLRTGHTPRQTPTTPRSARSPTSPGILESTQTSKMKPAKSPGLGQPRQDSTSVKSPVGKSPPFEGSPQMIPTNAWPLITPSRKEPVLHKNFQPGGKSAANAADILLQDVDESVTEETLDSVHLPASVRTPDEFNLPRIISPSSRGRSHTFDGTITKKTSPEFPPVRLEDLAEDSDGQSSSSLSQYDMYENRPLKPPQLVKSYLDQLGVDDKNGGRDPTKGSSRTELSNSEDCGKFVKTTAQRENGNRGPARHRDELRHIKDVAKTKRRLKRAVTPDGGRREVKGQETKHRGRKLSAPDESGSDFEKGHAATKIQALWRGLQARDKDEAILTVHDTLKSQRLDEHVQFLTVELERTRQLYEQEKHLRVLQMEALKLLWSQVKTLQEWKHSIDSKEVENSNHHQDGELADVERQDHHTKSQEHQDVNKEHQDVNQEHQDVNHKHHDKHQEHHNVAGYREQQLEQTCEHLQKEVSRLQASLDQISYYIAASQHHPGPFLGPQITETEERTSSGSEQKCKTNKTVKSEGSELSITTPKNVQAFCRSATSISVTWDPALVVDGARSEVGASVAGYKLHIDLRGSKWVMEVPGTQTSLGGLVPGTYKFAVSAFMSSIVSGISAWVEINLPQYAEGEQTLHHLEGENSLNGETHQAKTNSTTQRLDAEETDHDQDKSKANLVRSKVTVDDSSPTTQEIGDGVAMPVEESRRSDGNLEVANNIAREMSDEIVDSLLNRVLLEELNGPYVSSQSNHPGENSSVQDHFMSGGDPKYKTVKKEEKVTADRENSLLQSVMLENLDEEEQQCISHKQSGNCQNLADEDINAKCETRRVEQQKRGMKKPVQSKIAATFNFSDSFNVTGVVATTTSSKGDEVEGTKKLIESTKQKGHVMDTAKEAATFDVLLPVEKLIQDGTLCQEMEDDNDDDDNVFDDSQNIHFLRPDDEIQRKCNSKKVASPVLKPKRRKYGADKRTVGSSYLQPLQQYGRARTKSNSEVTKAMPTLSSSSPMSVATSNKIKSSRGKSSQPNKEAGSKIGVRRSGSEPNLSMTDSHFSRSKLFSSNFRVEKNSEWSNLRKGGSAWETSGIPKAGAIKNASGKNNNQRPGHMQCNMDHHVGSGQNSCGNFKGNKSKGSTIPALVSPGFHYPNNSCKLPMKHARNKVLMTSKGQRKSSEKVTIHRARNEGSNTMEVRQQDVNMNENSNNCKVGLEELTESWETVSSDEENET